MGFIYHDLGLILPSFTIIYHHFPSFQWVFPIFSHDFRPHKKASSAPLAWQSWALAMRLGSPAWRILGHPECQWIMDISRDVNKKMGIIQLSIL